MTPDQIFAQEVVPLMDRMSTHAETLCDNKHDAEDLVQDTLTRAYTGLKRNQYTPGSNMQAWLFRIMTNRYIDTYNKKAKQPTDVGLPDDYENYIPLADSAEDESILASIDPLLVDAINQLGPKLRDTVFLCDIKGYTYAQAADHLDTPIGTIMSRLHRARGLLREALIGYGESA